MPMNPEEMRQTHSPSLVSVAASSAEQPAAAAAAALPRSKSSNKIGEPTTASAAAAQAPSASAPADEAPPMPSPNAPPAVTASRELALVGDYVRAAQPQHAAWDSAGAAEHSPQQSAWRAQQSDAAQRPRYEQPADQPQAIATSSWLGVEHANAGNFRMDARLFPLYVDAFVIETFTGFLTSWWDQEHLATYAELTGTYWKVGDHNGFPIYRQAIPADASAANSLQLLLWYCTVPNRTGWYVSRQLFNSDEGMRAESPHAWISAGSPFGMPDIVHVP